MKLDLLTNATVVDDAIRFVAGKSTIRNLRSTDDKVDNEKSDSKQQEKPLEESTTVNRVF